MCQCGRIRDSLSLDNCVLTDSRQRVENIFILDISNQTANISDVPTEHTVISVISMNLMFFAVYCSIFSSSVTHIPGSASEVLIKRRPELIFELSVEGSAETRSEEDATRAPMKRLQCMMNSAKFGHLLSLDETFRGNTRPFVLFSSHTSPFCTSCVSCKS